MPAISLLPPRVPVVDTRTGMMSREWYAFFQRVFDRIGGPNGASITDLDISQFADAGIEEMKHGIEGDRNQFNSLPPLPQTQIMQDDSPVNDAVLQELLQKQTELESRLVQMRDELAEVTKELNSIRQGGSL